MNIDEGISVLKNLAVGGGGVDLRVLQAESPADLRLAFRMEQDGVMEDYEYVAQEDKVILKQVSGREKGSSQEVATLSDLIAARRALS